MKHTLTLFLLLAALTLAAQSNYSSCYTSNMKAGDAAYKQGKYTEAKTYYVKAKQCNGGNPAEAQKKINACDAKINPTPPPKPKPNPTPDASSSTSKSSQEFTVNGIAFKMTYVQGGTFTMGATSEQGSDAYDNETPSHSVTVENFWMGETEVTQALWKAVMDTEPSYNGGWEDKYGRGSAYPAYRVSWNEAVEFCNKLNEKLRSQLPSGYRFALPTEAQWEYAARGGNKSRGYKYSGSNTIGDVAWYTTNTNDQGSKPVKTKSPNELGLYDKSGNVYEWCQDWYSKDYYSVSPSNNPQGPSSGSFRVLCGGSWSSYARGCRVSYRDNGDPGYRSDNRGFRLVLVHQ